MKKQLWYKNWIWYYHLILFMIFFGFLAWGLYLCAFKEYWYVSRDPYKRFLNFDTLMSFYSVQVNIMTIVWLVFYLLNFKNKEYGVNNPRFRLAIMNLNLVVFIIFWVGIIYLAKTEYNFLSSYTFNQILCTVVTHFICPISLIIIYFFVAGEKQYGYLDVWKNWDIYVTYIYSFLYMIYIYVRGLMYVKDNIKNALNWPYPFLNFENLFIGNSLAGYMILLIVVFFIWLTAHHFLLIYINNVIYLLRDIKLNKRLKREINMDKNKDFKVNLN